MRQLLADLTQSLQTGRPCVYCSVVETRGSTPQKAGAAMLVFPDGAQRGTLGGGCVEAEVKQRALAVLAAGAGQPEVLTFNLDDNYGWDDGLICGGRMTILAAPVVSGQPGVVSGQWPVVSGSSLAHPQSGATTPPALATANGQLTTDYYRRFHEIVETGQGCIEAVIVNAPGAAPVGSRYLFDAAGAVTAQLAEAPPPAVVLEHLPPLAQRPRPSFRQGIAYLPVLPRITLLIVGGGHVGQAVGNLAADVDFEVWVLDDRAGYVSEERFPRATRRIVGDIGQKLQELSRMITSSVYTIIVTRGHGHDEEALYHLATTTAGYVGLIGSKRKIKMIFEDLIAKNIPAETLQRVHAPLGFAIGSQTVPEIAVSIVAELIAHRNLGAAEQVHHKDAAAATQARSLRP